MYSFSKNEKENNTEVPVAIGDANIFVLELAVVLFVAGADAVLGPANITKEDQIPVEQCINTCKLRPGSGCLGVKTLADGPTRVLQITDCLQQVRESEEPAAE